MGIRLGDTTALAVAIGRSIGIDDCLRDARSLEHLPAPFGEGVRRAVASQRTRSALRSVARAIDLGFVEHVSLRMRTLDRLVERAIERGARQLLVLGSGFDDRPARLPAVAEKRVSVFEIDRELRPLATESGAFTRTRVRVDLSEPSWMDDVTRAGFDLDKPTCAIMEGVSMYLPPEATSALARALAQAHASELTFAMTYLDTEAGALADWVRAVSAPAFRLIREPMIGAMSKAEVEARLGAEGFEIVQNSGRQEWAEQAGIEPSGLSFFEAERLLVARFRGGIRRPANEA